MNIRIMPVSFFFQIAMWAVAGGLVVQLIIFAFTPDMGMHAYGAMLVVIFFTFPGTHALLPSCTAQTFGQTYTSSNYGMIFWATVSFVVTKGTTDYRALHVYV
jgi:hypothetical protein